MPKGIEKELGLTKLLQKQYAFFGDRVYNALMSTL